MVQADGRRWLILACPAKCNAALLTNLRWNVVGSSLAKLLGLTRVGLMNDLVANACGIAGLPPEDLAMLNPGEPVAAGNQVVISAGTGLGKAGMACGRVRRVVRISGRADQPAQRFRPPMMPGRPPIPDG